MSERRFAGTADAPRPSSRGLVTRKRPRLAGVTVPLFSLRSRASWGIGEIGDLPAFAAWLKEEAGIGLVQILPLGEISGGETSPYGALTAFGLDPMYISVAAVAELAGHEREAIGDRGLEQLARARRAPRVDYAAVRALKARALGYAFKRFMADELTRATPRSREFLGFVESQRAWLDDYALFRALKDAHQGVAWWDWARGVRDREPAALVRARMDLSPDVLYYQYVQWVAHTQWWEARRALGALGVEVMGDLPFMVGRDSADVWGDRADFKMDGSVGAPPDTFDPVGQDWDLPPYAWAKMRTDDFAWLRRRARHMASLYDRFRIDHLVGFYRTYQRTRDQRFDADRKLRPGVFDPAEEEEQLAHGARVLTAMIEAARDGSASVVAEDLGSVPPAVRESLSELGVPGYKVVVWEKDETGYRDPKAYPETSVACFGTHDTAPVAAWWEQLTDAERAEFLALPAVRPRADSLGPAYDAAVHRTLLELLAASRSELCLLLFQELLGDKERINVPGTTGEKNWSYRLPAVLDELRADPAVRAKLALVRDVLAAATRTR